MTKMMGIALGVLGLAVGYIIASVWAVGKDVNLAIGVLLLITGAIVGFIIEWFIDESVRKNRELQRRLDERSDSGNPPAVVSSPPAVVEPHPIQQPVNDSMMLAEVLHQIKALRESPPVVAAGVVNTGDSQTLVEVLRQHNQELNKLSEQIAEKDIEVEYLRRKLEAYQKSHPDELTHVKGIGPVFQRKLRDAGFSSFEQLAGADPSQVRRMLGIKNWQRVDIESWIQQAKDWAEHS